MAFAKMSAIAITVNGEWRGGFIIPLFLPGRVLVKRSPITKPAIGRDAKKTISSSKIITGAI
ncbi:MAG: hypothetical protein LH647_10170 [Leptolyngbyaceae cyanobacterium CAN_BIN12]|nr:hypothetical protein [Leptolyngbyaceae cyanobacterium CAN_BIN12]